MNSRALSFIAVVGCLVGAPSSASALQYSFTNIADTTGSFNAFEPPLINDSGTVVFSATLDAAPSTLSIFVHSGGTTTTLYDNSGPLSSVGTPTLNNNGVVTFLAGFDGQGTNTFLVAGNGGPTTTIADTTGGVFSGFDGIPQINDNGLVAFSGNNFATPELFTSTDTSNPIYGTGGLFNSFGNVYGINDSGDVGFQAALAAGGEGIFIGNGGAPITIADTSGSFQSFLNRPLAINDSGLVVFQATLDSGGFGIFSGDGGAITTIVDDSILTGAFGDHALNDNGDMAFVGQFLSGPLGIYTGADSSANKVIEGGDPLFGSTVAGIVGTDLRLSRSGGMNNSGQIVFAYRLNDGRRGITVATPIPEPSSLGLLFLGMLILAGWRLKRCCFVAR